MSELLALLTVGSAASDLWSGFAWPSLDLPGLICTYLALTFRDLISAVTVVLRGTRVLTSGELDALWRKTEVRVPCHRD